MPYFEVPHNGKVYHPGGDNDASEEGRSDRLRIHYQLFGQGETKVLLIAGLACTLDVWWPQIEGLCGTNALNDSHNQETLDGECDKHKQEAKVYEDDKHCENDNCDTQSRVQVCAFDNRGVGKSSVPTSKLDYTTTIMARDAKALLDHLGWRKVHICGHSMGGMIACKLATMMPNCVASLALLSVTGGGYECLPKMNWASLSLAFRFLRAKSLQERALVDLDTHYTKGYLNVVVGEVKRRTLLHKEYVNAIERSGMQPKYGFNGHAHACWMHRMSATELQCLRSSGFAIAVLHGKGDIIAQIGHGRKLSSLLSPSSQMVEFYGGHLITHENNIEVNQVLIDFIQTGNCSIHTFNSANNLEDMERKTEAHINHFYRRSKRFFCIPYWRS